MYVPSLALLLAIYIQKYEYICKETTILFHLYYVLNLISPRSSISPRMTVRFKDYLDSETPYRNDVIVSLRFG